MDALPSPTGAKVEGWVYKHKRGAHSKFQKRCAVRDGDGPLQLLYRREARGAEGRATVLYAVGNNSGRLYSNGSAFLAGLEEPLEFTFRTEDGKFFDIVVDGGPRARRG